MASDVQGLLDRPRRRGHRRRRQPARAALGASVAVHEDNGWGAEIDFGHSSDAPVGPAVLDVTSYMVNAIWIKPDGLVRPFGSAARGILQVNGCDSPCNVPARTYDFGVSVGGGAFCHAQRRRGVSRRRAVLLLVRRSCRLRRPDNFGFWRALGRRDVSCGRSRRNSFGEP